MAGKDITLAIKIAGEIDKSLDNSINISKGKLNKLAVDAALAVQKAESSAKSWESFDSGVEKLTDGALKVTKAVVAGAAAAATAAAGAGVAIVKIGSDFESAFAGVRKTVDATDVELSTLEDNIRAMAKEKPQTAVELSEIAEAAGQLGIKTENIAAFTSTIADLKEATNLGDEGASEMAKFANITGMSQEKFSNLGSTIVDLGNHMATTEQDIMSMGMRLAGAGAQIGMTEADILGFSAALSSVGVEAEMGGSALSKTMINMQLAVEQGANPWGELQKVADTTGRSLENVINTVTVGGKGLKLLAQQTGMTTAELKKMKKSADEGQGELQSYADVAGMTTEAFSELFRTNPAQALSAFITGIGDTERNGKSAIMVLDEMGISEVRQRDALLRAANASGLFSDALTMANDAFEENTALTKEASQRYQTFESRLGILKNRVTDFGITLYQDMRDPLNDILGLALDETKSFGFLDPSKIEAFAESMRENIPTAVREAKQLGSAFMDFAGPLVSGAIDNLNLIGSGIAGIATTIAVLNAVKKAREFGSALSAFKLLAVGNPMIMIATGAAAAAGAIAGVAINMKLLREQAESDNLAEHFGNIALSIDDLKDAAGQIIDNGSLEQLDTLIEQFDNVEESARSLQKASRTMDKLDWKIRVGLTLSETELENYKAALDQYVQDAADYVEGKRYSVNLALGLFTEDDEEGSEIRERFEGFYTELSGDVQRLGQELGDLYAKSIEDGIITPIEEETILEKRRQLQELTDKLAAAEYQGDMQAIAMKYGDSGLTADSFKNLQDELNERNKEEQKRLLKSLSELNVQNDAMLQDGKITQEEFDQQKEVFASGYRKEIADLSTNSSNFQLDVIKKNYQKEFENLQNETLNKLMSDMMATLQNGMSLNMWQDYSMQDILTQNMDQSTVDALSSLWDSYKVSYEQMQAIAQQYRDAGEEIPEALREGIANGAALGAIAGDEAALWELVASGMSDSPEFAAAVEAAQASGAAMPDAVSQAIRDKNGEPAREVDTMFRNVRTKLDAWLRQGMEGELPVNIRIRSNVIGDNPEERVTSTLGLNKILRSGNRDSSGGGDTTGITKHAEGGILTQPHLGLVAEDGPEAVIPLNGTPRAKTLWQRAGELLGLFDSGKGAGVSAAGDMAGQYGTTGNTPQPAFSYGWDTGNSDKESGTVTVNYSPNIVVNGTSGNVREDVGNALRDGYEEFKRMMEQYMKDQRRLSFGR